MAQMLANQEGIGTLLNHQHRGCVLENMRVLQRLTEPSLARYLTEQFEDSRPVELGALPTVEYEVIRIRLANGEPFLERSGFIEQSITLHLQQILCRVKRALQSSNVYLLCFEVDIGDFQVGDFLCPSTVRDREEEHRMLSWAVFLRSVQETLQLFAAQVGDARAHLLRSLPRHHGYVPQSAWCH